MNSNLLRALSAFAEDLWIPMEDSLGTLKEEIKNKSLDKVSLTEEYKNAISDSTFDWVDLASQSELLISPNNYDNVEISNYVQGLLNDYLFPNECIDEQEQHQVLRDLQQLLLNKKSDQLWIHAYEVFELLKKKHAHNRLRYYHLYGLSY